MALLNDLDMFSDSACQKECSLDQDSPSFAYEDWLRSRFQGSEQDDKNRMGVACRSLSVYTPVTQNNYQPTFANLPLKYLNLLISFSSQRQKLRIDLLQNFDGLVTSEKMLLILGRPNSGCSTVLKTLCDKISGFHIANKSMINYQGEFHPTLMILVTDNKA